MFRISKIILTFLMLMVFAGSVFPDAAEEFEMGNNFYKDKDFKSAVRMYEAILNDGYESAALYYNLGNAYFKNGDLGHAIRNYMKAKRLDPSDKDIRDNLEFARRFSRIQMEGVELNPINSFLKGLVDNYRLNELAWFSSILFILFTGTLIIRFGLGYNNSIVRIGIILTLVFVLILSGLTTFKYRDDYITKRGVIVADEVSIYTGGSEQSDVELEAAPGLIFEIIDENSNFYKVLFENKRQGWVKKDLVVVI